MVRPFFLGLGGMLISSFLLVWGRLIATWWSGCFAGVFADFVVQRGGKSW
jgi:hypothetical protein